MKTLLLLRHAKSDWNADYGLDHDRPLNDRGVRSAGIIGRILAGRDLVPDHIVSSTAVRARKTVELAAAAGAWSSSVSLDERLYGTGWPTVLEVGAEAPDVERLMLVGHQPTWSSVAFQLTGEDVEMKTATVAGIELAIDSWSQLANADGDLFVHINPRQFFGSEWDSD